MTYIYTVYTVRSKYKTGYKFYSQIFAKYLLLKIALCISYCCATNHPNTHWLRTIVIYPVLASAAWLGFSRPKFGSAGQLCISLQGYRLVGSALPRPSLIQLCSERLSFLGKWATPRPSSHDDGRSTRKGDTQGFSRPRLELTHSHCSVHAIGQSKSHALVDSIWP